MSSNIPGHSRQPANQPLGEKSRQEADEHDGKHPAICAAVQRYETGADEQIGHVAEDHGQQRQCHVPEPLVARGHAVAAQVVGNPGQYLGRGTQAREERGPEGHAQNTHLGESGDHEAEENDGQRGKDHCINPVELEEVGEGPQAMKSGAFDLDLGIIYGRGKLVLGPVAVEV